MARRDRAPLGAHRVRPALTTVALATIGTQYVASLVALGQWTPFQALPGKLCRWQGPRVPARVAITFDDGPDPVVTPRVLDRLDELRIRATFFPLGSRAAHEPELVAEIARRGHVVGTHGYEHRHHLFRGPAWIRRDLARACETMHVAGFPPTWYRPAYGQATAATLLAARAMGLQTVLWSAWGREWVTRDPRDVAARIVRHLRPGAIVLLHDSDLFGPPGMWRTGLEALGVVGAEMDRRGLTPVTLDEMVL